jgi:hypothetical protein
MLSGGLRFVSKNAFQGRLLIGMGRHKQHPEFTGEYLSQMQLMKKDTT